MNIILLAVSSLDGFITRGNEANIYEWTSPEDSKIYFQKIEDAELIFMGGKTFGIARHFMKSKEGRTRVVFTRNVKKYNSEVIPGFLEFTDNLPLDIVRKYEDQGVTEALLVGGSEINTLFLKENKVDEIHLTVEPVIFGEGKRLFSEAVNVQLELLSSEKLNSRGTVLLKYKVLGS